MQNSSNYPKEVWLTRPSLSCTRKVANSLMWREHVAQSLTEAPSTPEEQSDDLWGVRLI
jgi:hypothetical protein